MLESPAFTEEMLRPLVARFYDRLRADPALGPIFSAVISDWSDHPTHLADFWTSVMLGTGRKGYPVALHLRHAADLTPALLRRWLSLWRMTADEMPPCASVGPAQTKASNIAETFQRAMLHQRPTAAHAYAGMTA